jgi:ADP-ribosylglycohydrolase
MASSIEERLARARVSLEGLSVGDSFGGFFEFSGPDKLSHFIKDRQLVSGPWRFTDDTNMALSIYAILRKYGEINQDALAQSFAKHYHRARGYGPAMHRVMAQLLAGMPWQSVAKDLFSGQGSFGNGGAMRVAPLGAYFADDIGALVENARRSAEVTHAHPEGVAGAIAVAVGAAVAWNLRGQSPPTRQEFIDLVFPHVPDSEVREKIRHARELAPGSTLRLAVSALGNGSRISAQDTVPFVLWCAGEQLGDYQEAIWLTSAGGGDVDTTCAMVGGIVASYTGVEGIPAEWIKRREPLPDWTFEE